MSFAQTQVSPKAANSEIRSSNTFRNLFTLNWTDGFLLFSFITLSTCVLTAFSASIATNSLASAPYAPLFSGWIGLNLAAGMLVSCGRFQPTSYLVVSGTLLIGLLVHWGTISLLIPSQCLESVVAVFGNQEMENVWPFQSAWICFGFGLIGIPAGFLSGIIYLGFVQVALRILRAKWLFRLTGSNRTKSLFVLMGVLFAIHIATQLLDSPIHLLVNPNLLKFSKLPIGMLLDILFQFLVYLALIGLIICFIETRFPLYTKLLTSILIILVGSAIAHLPFLSSRLQSKEIFSVISGSSLLGIASFFLGIVLVNSRTIVSGQSNPNKMNDLPSVWTYLYLIPVIVLVFIGFRFVDPLLLVSSQRDQSLSVRWQRAIYSRKINHETSGAASLISYAGQFILSVKIRDERDADVLRNEFDLEQNSILLINNAQPFVDFSKLNKPLQTVPRRNSIDGLTVILAGGEIDQDQAKDILERADFLSVTGQIKLPKMDEPIQLVKEPGWYFFQKLDGQRHSFANFFSTMLCRPGAANVAISGELSDDELNAVFDMIQIRTVFLQNANEKLIHALKKRIQADPSISLGMLNLYPDPNQPKLWLHVLELVLETDFNLSFQPVNDPPLMWKLSFLAKGRISFLNAAYFLNLNNEQFQQKADQAGLIFEKRGGLIDSVWLPESSLIDQYPQLFESLRILRLDVRKINPSFAPGSVLVDSVDLRKLSALEELYLPAGVQLDDLEFLNNLTELKKLQIAVQNRDLLGTEATGFEVCQNLEEIIFFGKPDDQTIAELNLLPKLRKIKVVDDLAELISKSERTEFKDLFESVEVEIIDSQKFKPFVSKAWTNHLVRLKADIQQAIRKLKQSDELD